MVRLAWSPREANLSSHSSDPVGIMSMITYAEQHYGGNPNAVYVTGASSGAMMTNVLLADYPDVFKAGAALMGVPYHCFYTGPVDGWNSQCANGQVSSIPVNGSVTVGFQGTWTNSNAVPTTFTLNGTACS